MKTNVNDIENIVDISEGLCYDSDTDYNSMSMQLGLRSILEQTIKVCDSLEQDIKEISILDLDINKKEDTRLLKVLTSLVGIYQVINTESNNLYYFIEKAKMKCNIKMDDNESLLDLRSVNEMLILLKKEQ